MQQRRRRRWSAAWLGAGLALAVGPACRADADLLCRGGPEAASGAAGMGPGDEASRDGHPGISFHGVYPHDSYDDHRYDLARHAVDKLSGTSRYSRAPSVLGMAPRGRGGRTSAAAPRPPEDLPAWTLLREGRAAEARAKFRERIHSNAAPALDQLGLALAAAELGELEDGVRAMREVFRLDAEAARCAPLGDALHERIRGLLARYAEEPGRLAMGDLAFMRAALHALLGDFAEADDAIRRSARRGDESPSAAGLRRMLDRQLLTPL